MSPGHFRPARIREAGSGSGIMSLRVRLPGCSHEPVEIYNEL